MTAEPQTEKLIPPPVIPGRNVPSTPPPNWPLTVSNWGRTGEVPQVPPAARPWVTSEVPPWVAARTERNRNWTVLLVLSAILLSLIVTCSVAVQRLNLLPAGVPLIGKDSGLAACQAISEGGNLASSPGAKMTKDEYQDVRAVFEHSRYKAIRDNGTEVIDIAWQVQAISATADNTDLMSALAYMTDLTRAYSGLSGGCAAVGYPIPPLTTS